MRKYSLTRELVERNLPAVKLCVPQAASNAQLALAHAKDYIEKVDSGRLSQQEQREVGFPWSQEMVARSRRSVGATISACRRALSDGVSVNLAGGTHHAYADKGSGFCVFNDAAVAARQMQLETLAGHVAIVDLDVHQGNGSASIFHDDPSVFTLSLHAQGNFPFRKERSDLDVALPDGTGDDGYLEALGAALAELDDRFTPDLVIYLAGADPYEGDRLGRLKLSMQGLASRDRAVFDWAASHELAVAVVMAGGYGHRIEETCAIHEQTVALALEFFESHAPHRSQFPHSAMSP
jgi:acetoin utilization deacetylase AcuC-like enzyme